MMDRLRDHKSTTDPVLARAARLARAVAPSPPPVGLEQRVRASLVHGRRRPRVWRLRPVGALLLLVVAGTAAAAAATAVRAAWGWASAWVAPAERAPLFSSAPREAPTLAAPAAAPKMGDENPAALAARAKSAVETPVTVAAPVVAAPKLSSDDRPGAAPSPRAEGGRRVGARIARVKARASSAARSDALPGDSSQSTQPSASGAQPEEIEAVLVVEATRALKGDDRNAQAALWLVDQYLHRYPQGDLVEESIALKIEAMSLLNDPEAGGLAADYLRRYPTGRFRSQALDAQRRFGN